MFNYASVIGILGMGVATLMPFPGGGVSAGRHDARQPELRARHIKLRALPDSDLKLEEAFLTVDKDGRGRLYLSGPFKSGQLERLISMVNLRDGTYRILKLDDPAKDAKRLHNIYAAAGVSASEGQIRAHLEEARKVALDRLASHRAQNHRPDRQQVGRAGVPASIATREAESDDAGSESLEVHSVQNPIYCDGWGFAAVRTYEPARYIFDVAWLNETNRSASWRVYPGSSIQVSGSGQCWANPLTFIFTSWSTIFCSNPPASIYGDSFDATTTGMYYNQDFLYDGHAVVVVSSASVEYTYGTPIWGYSYDDIPLGRYNWYEDIFLTNYHFGFAETRSCAYPPGEEACVSADGYWDGELCFYSPILVDTGKDGFTLTDAARGVAFDANADGVPDRIAWTDARGNDAWLALDRNGNGRIDDGTELFGNFTPDATGGPAANGFEALKALDGNATDATARDGVIDARDDAFGGLLLWHDANQNGISEANELVRCADAGVLAIYTAYRNSHREDRYGNQFRQRARIVWEDGRAWTYDVWLRRQ